MKNISIESVNVYGLRESVAASGYPMKPNPERIEDTELDISSYRRASKLGSSKSGSGHDCFLKGIVVQFDVTFAQYMWNQAKRYHWFDFVSSTSTMHRITKMDIKKSCHRHVSMKLIKILEFMVSMYNNLDSRSKLDDNEIKSLNECGVDFVENKDELFHAIIANIPSGFMLKARITTNYLQLKTMYNQRKHHKLDDWREFCAWCETLPCFVEFTQKKEK